MWPFSSSYPEVRAAEVDGQTFDYIIVGGGTAGCVVASRLSEDASVSVLVLEKGHVKDNFLSRMPLLSQNFEFPLLQVVARLSEPISEVGGRRARMWTAEAVGGASRINAMLLTRGLPGGYNHWAHDFGLADWSWDKVEPYFRKSERAVAHPHAAHRGHDGPIENKQADTLLGCIPYVERAARAVDLPVHQDMNDPSASAQGYFHLDQTVNAKGVRVSAYEAWLNRRVATERKSHLTVCTGVVASKLVANQDGTRVGAVKIRNVGPGNGSRDFVVNARREVIVCSGSVCTPQLLMLSGIGPRDQLEQFNIPAVRELDAVGRNLSDHASFPVLMQLPRKHTLHTLENGLVFFWNLILYILFGTGLLAIGTTARSIFVRTTALDEQTMTVRSTDDEGNSTLDPSMPRNVPDVEVMVIPVNCLAESVPGRVLFGWYSTLVQPFSRGRVELASTDPQDHPKTNYPMLTDQRDLVPMRKATRFSMRLADEFANNCDYPHPAPLIFAPGMDLDWFDSICQPNKGKSWWSGGGKAKPDISPAPGVPVPPLAVGQAPLQKAAVTREKSREHEQQQRRSWQTVSDTEIDEYAKRVCVSSFHFSCTCRMSLDATDGVVDQRLMVHGFENLRVADASVFPQIPSAHTMAPTVMVAERCADFVKSKWAEEKTK
ncbi:hypothetical protein B0T26DRAFT_743389 [Lasiosphaeria miniovina]|uniref:Glucose-methanol-choline oxidoreductase N-terminal domain-containing protein n=1 Tax=Lasiosphaeria miniovina TaxID=1954250 RepID=A0AA40DSF9_9PEZI|nr:uncharacterized protein B0T26DRAFT_743389 [Lasiosphaeria miniovina]KAK0710298.1 hypothetical protein B0T26DRAFT_743389 [Lasiosphaeria miniovina]